LTAVNAFDELCR